MSSARSVEKWYAIDPRHLLDEHVRSGLERALTNRAPTSRDARALVERVEHAVAARPEEAFSFDAEGYATLSFSGRAFSAGHFSTPSIGELRSRLGASPAPKQGRARLSVLHGDHVLTDIGTLQAAAGPGAVFQVASQFNCLEATSESIVPVSRYFGDPTQGPRASVSAFPATLLRHYRAVAEDGSRYEQTNARCVNLLVDAIPEGVARVRAGYLLSHEIRDATALARAFERDFDRLRVGLHDRVEVVFGNAWGGPVPAPTPRIAQVFTSTLALGGYSRDDGSSALATVRRQLLRAAYLGTLLAAAALQKESVILTLIGGGVFGNPHSDIWDAISFALGELDGHLSNDLDVVVNLREAARAHALHAVRARGGFIAHFEQGRVTLDAD